MKTMKRTFSLFLALALLCGTLTLPASAAVTQPMTAANALYELDLFRGVGTLPSGRPDFALENTATRGEAAAMLTRLLGAEQEATSRHYQSPFTDTGWAKDYIGYVYTKGITKGVSNTKVGTGSTITAAEFVTLVMRALGYSNVDYKNPFSAAKAAGLTCSNKTPFTRGDMAVICCSALFCTMSGKTQTLSQQLVSSGTVQKTKAFYAELLNKYDNFNATMPVEGDYLTNYYPGLSAVSTNQKTIYTTMISAAVCEIALVEVKNASDVQKVKDIFQARIDAQVGTDDAPGGAWYPASIEGWKTGSRIVSKGNYVMMVAFPEGADRIVADFNGQF